jgi:phosphatidylglycerol lysyltransferase
VFRIIGIIGLFAVLTDRQTVPQILKELRDVSNAWLADKQMPEKGFSLGFFNEDYLKCFHCAVVRHEGEIIAFANVWEGAGREELSVDLMRYRPGSPAGVMEYLFVELMLWGEAEGFRWFNLGMAPLSGIEDRPTAPLWNRAAGMMFQHGEHFYGFQGLREYKEKFDPQWSPKYLACPGGWTLPRILADVTALISRPRSRHLPARPAPTLTTSETT